MKKILVVEDDVGINGLLVESFTREGYEVVSAFSGTEALLRMDNTVFDLMILDLMLPGMDGKQVLKEVRERTEMPVIVLSARGELDAKVDLLTLGANDYMTKPFEIEELLVRVMVQLRNANGTEAGERVISYRDIAYDVSRKQLTVCGKVCSFTAQELKIMELLLQRPDKVFSKNEIYEYAWDDYYMGEDKTINVHISNIRKKIKEFTDKEYIETVWGLGFKMV